MKLFHKGQLVRHPKYGVGTVIDIIPRGYAVKFDKGGPQGWVDRSNHDPNELEAIQ